jgi:hypothetical protein
MDSEGATDQPVRFGARTWRGVLGLLGVGAAAIGILAFVLARSLIVQGFDWVDPVMLVPIPVVIAIGLVILGTITEWTIADHELRRRGWLSRPGSKPASVLQLGPQLEIAHETRSGWRIRPYGQPPGWPAPGSLEPPDQVSCGHDDPPHYRPCTS